MSGVPCVTIGSITYACQKDSLWNTCSAHGRAKWFAEKRRGSIWIGATRSGANGMQKLAVSLSMTDTYAGRIYIGPRRANHLESPWHREIISVQDGVSGGLNCVVVRYRALSHGGRVCECPLSAWRRWARSARRVK